MVRLNLELFETDQDAFPLFETDKQGKKWTFHRKSWAKISRANFSFLSKQVIGFTLNVCCGLDATGDVKVDLDLSNCRNQKAWFHNGEIICADIRYLPFRGGTFDTVICDPPFRFYSRFKWALALSDLARKKLILSGPARNLFFKGWADELYYTRSESGNSNTIRLWFVFTRLESLN